MSRKLDRNNYLDEQEVRRLRRACQDQAIADNSQGRTTGPKVWMVVDLALSTGLRVAELASLTIEDIDWTTKAIRVARRKKRRAGRIVHEYIPMSPRLAEHLKDYLGDRTTGPIVIGNRGPLTKFGWQQVWQGACRRTAGVRPLSIHKARHTVGTLLYRSTHDLRLVQLQLGHESPSMTAIYADVSFEDRAAGLERMEKTTE